MINVKNKLKRIRQHISDLKNHYEPLLSGAKNTYPKVKHIPESRTVYKDIMVYEELIKDLTLMEARIEKMEELLKADKLDMPLLQEAVETGELDLKKALEGSKRRPRAFA